MKSAITVIVAAATIIALGVFAEQEYRAHQQKQYKEASAELQKALDEQWCEIGKMKRDRILVTAHCKR
jgi:predicted negative regulator of RcsB-dependent stress response